MENWTFGDAASIITFAVGFVGGIIALYHLIKKGLEKMFSEQFQTINASIEKLGNKIDKVDMEACKNYLVKCLNDWEIRDEISEIEKARILEQYEHYIKLGGNSYIKHRIEKLEAEGKL